MPQPDRSQLHFLGVLLRPIGRYCLKRGITLNAIVETLKNVLVELAADEIREGRRKITISKLSLMTGVHRPDVSRIYREGRSFQTSLSLAQRVIGQWEQDERFNTKTGRPKVLSYGEDKSEFTSLVRTVSTDINPAAMLDELERVGAAERVKNGVKLARPMEYLTGDPQKLLAHFARDAEAYSCAVEENLFQPKPVRNLYLTTEYDNILKSAIPTIRQWVLEQGVRYHKELRDYLSRYDKDINPDPDAEGGMRVVVGAFSLTTEEKEV